MTNLSGKVALVTGSARGIGKAIAERYASLGADIVINYTRDETAANATVESIKKLGRNAIAIRCDVSKTAEIRNLFETAKQSLGKIDIVVVNAGVELVGIPVADFSEEQFDHMFGINTKGAFFTMQEAAKHVADNGRIIYISSSTSGYPRAGYALHGGSKVAPEYLVRILAQELGKRGITVNSILPTATEGAGVNANIQDKVRIQKFIDEFAPMGRLAVVEDVANVAEFFAGELSSFVSGQHLLLSGGGLT
ncbi:SDR family oxidoreductase [Mucilaginibacter sp. KACC 22773]|uniref:SDR family NAD(P)-dependent oxidoreductase n=1 Tax=Mucilaginibacter sp. KACC 22773 TaxID=3025671 RepID=UPI002366ABD8|nr:SDR family oxidoreductase [Mucilaginibacter sp. KACC 22773]WDF77095.1 SDR family oxidoreductase [Mucilaginibacter sp. KACC 22773]